VSGAVADIEEVIRRRIRELEEAERGYRTICVRLPRELYEKLARIAQSNNVDRERLVVELIKSYVEGYYGRGEGSQ
jgi:metal-responsive CopG/Arc/MetJ family transcriptional regulator